MSEPRSFPLQWPNNWPRAPHRQQSKFKAPDLNRAVNKIEDEVERLDGKGLVISTNLKPTLSSKPEFVSTTGDVGAAVYFNFKNTPIALACDKWNRVQDNLWAIACHIENLRAQERWGVGRLEQAFAGYKALPEQAGAVTWWGVFGFKTEADALCGSASIREKYKALCRQHHPDTGGSNERMVELNMAYSDAAKRLKEHGIIL